MTSTSAGRPPPLLLKALLLAGLALLASGCATVRRVPLEPSSRLLVVVEDAPTAEQARSRESELVRLLSLVPLRAWPSDAEAALAGELVGSAEARTGSAREAAEERRLPWLLVLDGAEARLETARHGEVLWTTRVRGGDDGPERS